MDQPPHAAPASATALEETPANRTDGSALIAALALIHYLTYRIDLVAPERPTSRALVAPTVTCPRRRSREISALNPALTARSMSRSCPATTMMRLDRSDNLVQTR